MTYQQSLEMIEKLKNIVWPISPKWYVYFNFTSETNFEIEFIEDTEENSKKMSEYMNQKYEFGLAIANIIMHDDDSLSFYYDGFQYCIRHQSYNTY